MVGHITNSRKLKSYQHFLRSQGHERRHNLKEKTQKHQNSWRLKSVLLNNECFNNEIKEEI